MNHAAPRGGTVRTIRLLVALALLFATAAHAGRLYLRWNACFGDGGVQNRAFACDTNLGSEQLVATFNLPVAVDSVMSVDGFINIYFFGPALPAWWEFGVAGNCRPSSLVASATLPAGASSCIDFADFTRDAFYIYQAGPFPNTARLEVLSPFIPQGAFHLAAGQEYLAFTVTINQQKTVGAGACDGCLGPVCLGFDQMRLMRRPPDFVNVFPTSGTTHVATWQGSTIPFFCVGNTPTRRSTWGEVKALYR